MREIPDAHIWRIDFTIPAGTEAVRWNKNMSATVLSPTAERAIECVRTKFPDGTILSVHHFTKANTVLISDALRIDG